MIKKELIWCVQCNALALFTPLDQTPEYENQHGKWKVLEKDDRASFMRAHRGHHLEELHAIEDSFISHQSYLEPVRTSYFEATIGKQRFVVKKFRKSILDPQSYELIPGKLRLIHNEPSVDSVAIQKELEREFSPLLLPPKKIHRFVRQLAEAVSHLNPGELKRARFESDNPSLWYFTLDKKILDRVLETSSGFLTKRESKLLGEYVRKNIDEPFFMAVAKVEFQIEKIGEDKKTEIIAA